MSLWIKRTLWSLAALVGAIVAGFVYLQVTYPMHRHCIKLAGTAFRLYAKDHEGRLPFDTNGFCDALLLLVKNGGMGYPQDGVHYVTGGDDDGRIFQAALVSGAHIPEEKCSRVYIQGLSETNDPNIAILFDRYSAPGGDHFHSPWGPLEREVCLLDGSMQIITETKWAQFSNNQIELLVRNGIPRATAQHCYALTKL